MTVRIKTDQNQWQRYNLVLDETNNKIHLVSQNTSDIINYQQQLSNMLASAIERFALWGIAMKAWTSISGSISECIGYVNEVDEAMNNIRRITMDTHAEAMNLAKTYNQIAIDLSASTLEVASAAGTWLRQRFSSEETNTLVKDSIILSKLAMIDSASATQYLTSTLKGYKLEAEDVIGVIDKMVTIDFKAATTAQDVAEALSRGVDEYGNNISLSADKYQRYKEIVSTVLGYSPSLITGYNKEGEAIANKNGLIEQSIALLKEENKQKLQSMVSDESLKTLLNGTSVQIKQAEKSLGNVKTPEFLIPKIPKLFTPENIFSFSLEDSFKTETLSANLRKTLQDITGVQIKLGQSINKYVAENFESISGNLDTLKDKYSQIVEEQYRNNLKRLPIKPNSEAESTLIQNVREKVSREINEYIKAIKSAQKEIETAQKTFNPTLGLIAQASEGYDSLSDAGKNIVTKFVDGS